MPEDLAPRRIPLIFYAIRSGVEPVRDWLRGLPQAERHAIGLDSCVRNGGGPWACRCAGPSAAACGRCARICQRAGPQRVLLCLHNGQLVALHGFIKKTRATSADDLALARKRQKELQQ